MQAGAPVLPHRWNSDGALHPSSHSNGRVPQSVLGTSGSSQSGTACAPHWRWLKAGVFDAIVHGLHVVLRLAQGGKKVGAPGFEPGTFGSQNRRATKLRYAPREEVLYGWKCRKTGKRH